MNLKSLLTPSLFGAALAACLTSPLLATDYTWTTTGTTGLDWTGANAKWSPSGTPSSGTDNAAFTVSASTVVNLNGSYTIGALGVTGNGGQTFTLAASGGNQTLSLASLTKSPNSNTVLFRNGSSALLDLTVSEGASLANGTYKFGSTTAATALDRLTIDGFTLTNSNSSSTVVVDLNVSHDYSLGVISFSGSGSTLTSSRTLNLIASTEAGYSRTVTVGGISQSIGNAGVINASKLSAASGTHAATLQIDTAGSGYSTTSILADGTGGSLIVKKQGEGTQTLAGANTYTGGTVVEAGTLAVSGSLASAGDLGVSAGATFLAAGALAVGDVSLQSGAILGFDLSGTSSLAIGGDLLKSGPGAATFTVDFRNTGVFGQTYSNLLSVTGSALNDFAGSTLSYINFGADGASGTLSFSQLTGSFSVAAIPEPSTCALLGGAAVLALAFWRKRLRVRA